MIIRNSIGGLQTELRKSYDQMSFRCPVIYTIAPGRYAVSNTRGGYYEVVCGRMENGMVFVACQCQASLHGKHCYHGLKALDTHIEIKQKEK